LENAARGHATGGMTINLQDARHKAGRTWGTKSQSTLGRPRAEIASINKGPLDPDARRTAVIQMFKVELDDDANFMISVAGRKDEDPIWNDLRDPKLELDDPKPFIQKVREQIIAGEAAMKTQDLSGYKSPGS
jgi:hypothetical protein